jgi:hypothetical protein
MDFWRKLPPGMRLLVVTGFVALMVAVGTQFHVSSQGDRSSTYPKGYRGGTCTIETETLLVGYSAYFIPSDYEIPDDPTSAKAVPVLCGKVPSPGTLNVTLDLLYPESARYRRCTNLGLSLRHSSLIRLGNTPSISTVNVPLVPSSSYRYRSKWGQTGKIMQPGTGLRHWCSFLS